MMSAGRRPRFLVAGAIAIVALLAGGVGMRMFAGADVGHRRAGTVVDDSGRYDHDFTITPGTAAAIRAGEDVEIVPRELVVHVGETIRITNHDSQDHLVGVFFVGSGEMLTQRFTTEGVLEGACSIHPTGRFTVRVLA
ncbi:MAG: hypothetical protein ABIO83_08960 [Ilumatobacteraceae bacterium]